MDCKAGKTKAVVISDVNQSELKTNDIGYIDGYIQAADGRPYAVFVRVNDGHIDLASTYQIKAILD